MTTLHTNHNFYAHSVSNTHAHGVLQRVANTFKVWAHRAKNRRELRTLVPADDRILKDIGVRRQDVAREAFKPFWRA